MSPSENVSGNHVSSPPSIHGHPNSCSAVINHVTNVSLESMVHVTRDSRSNSDFLTQAVVNIKLVDFNYSGFEFCLQEALIVIADAVTGIRHGSVPGCTDV